MKLNNRDKNKKLNNIPVIKLNNEIIEIKNHAKYLGLTLDSKMNQLFQINRMRCKFNQTYYMTNKIIKNTPEDVGILLYKTLLRTLLEFG